MTPWHTSTPARRIPAHRLHYTTLLKFDMMFEIDFCSLAVHNFCRQRPRTFAGPTKLLARMGTHASQSVFLALPTGVWDMLHAIPSRCGSDHTHSCKSYGAGRRHVEWLVAWTPMYQRWRPHNAVKTFPANLHTHRYIDYLRAERPRVHVSLL